MMILPDDCEPRINVDEESVTCSDNLEYMASLPDARCDLIYADPPFNSERTLESKEREDAKFSDRHGGIQGYLSFLRPRLIEMHRLLSRRGSLFIHVDWRTTHHVRLLLDEVFRPENFLNEIIWHYRSGGRPAPWFARKHDTILWYARHVGEHTFNRQRDGEYRTRDLKMTPDGTPYKSTRNGPIMFDPRGPACTDVWDIPILSTVSRERVSYPTQKPERLLKRIILSASSPGDRVADFFCGSGTTLVVAKRHGRKILGCDINNAAVAITNQRLQTLQTELPL